MSLSQLLLSSSAALVLADRRLYNYLLYKAFQSTLTEGVLTIAFTELVGVYGVEKPTRTQLQASLQKLLRTLVEFELTEQGESRWHLTALLAEAVIDEKNETLTYRYSKACLLLLCDPIYLEKCLIQTHFNYKYSNLLYEKLATEYYAGKGEALIELAVLREDLHIEPDKMPNFTDFNRFVLSPALKEINAYASFAVKVDSLCEGRKVTQLQFHFTNKTPVAALNAKEVIPPRRPKLFIEDAKEALAYAYLLNATTIERRKYFSLAQKKSGKLIPEAHFDRPDLWYHFVLGALKNRRK